MISSWTGLVLPNTAPNEMSTEPVQKSALIILKVAGDRNDSHCSNAMMKVVSQCCLSVVR